MSSYALIYHYKNDNLHFTDRNRVNMFLNNQENKLMKWKIKQNKKVCTSIKKLLRQKHRAKWQAQMPRVYDNKAEDYS